MKNLIISLLLTKVLEDNIMVPCTGPELAGMVIAVFTMVTITEYFFESLRQQVRRKRRR